MRVGLMFGGTRGLRVENETFRWTSLRTSRTNSSGTASLACTGCEAYLNGTLLRFDCSLICVLLRERQILSEAPAANVQARRAGPGGSFDRAV
jgi:hypothetical protein